MAMMATNDEVDLDELVQEVIREFPPRPMGIRDGWVKKSGIGRKEYVGSIIDREKEKEEEVDTKTPDENSIGVPEYFSSQYVWSDFDLEREQKEEEEENSGLVSPSDSNAGSVNEFIEMFFGPMFNDVMAFDSPFPRFDLCHDLLLCRRSSLRGYFDIGNMPLYLRSK